AARTWCEADDRPLPPRRHREWQATCLSPCILRDAAASNRMIAIHRHHTRVSCEDSQNHIRWCRLLWRPVPFHHMRRQRARKSIFVEIRHDDDEGGLELHEHVRRRMVINLLIYKVIWDRSEIAMTCNFSFAGCIWL